jgi:anaerobic magnesium-protoporphyrin IX monomethyl ester cyclase
MKIILTTAPRSVGDIERGGLPFLSLGYLASSLLLDGHDVRIVDAHTMRINPEEAGNRTLQLDPEAVGIIANTHNRFPAIELVKFLKKKKPNLKIILGGPHFGVTALDAMKVIPEIDFIVKGEGELTTRELLKTNFEMTKLKDLPGLVYRDQNGLVIENIDRPFIKNLDDLPMPAWHLFDFSIYKTKPLLPGGGKVIGLMSSRGCPSRCIFCASIALHKGMFRRHSPKKFVDEIENLYKNYGYRSFNFWDDTFTVLKSHTTEVCEEIIRRKLDISWYTPCRVNTPDAELFRLMKKAGCVRVNFGIEAGSPRILKIIKKGITMEQARSAIKAAVDVGLEVTCNFLVVHPYETWEDIKMTVDAMKEFKAIKNVIPSYSFINIYPGTELEEIAKKEGLMPVDFSWNSPYSNEMWAVAGEDPSVYYFEWPTLPFADVKAFISKRMMGRNELIKKLISKIRKVKNMKEVFQLFTMAFKYLKK